MPSTPATGQAPEASEGRDRPAGRLVLVTGASSGIGDATARAFVARGDRVIAVARTAARLNRLADQLGGPPRVATIPTDLTDGASATAMATRVLTEHGVPDVVVANAGLGLDALFAETSDKSLRQIFDINVFGLVRSVRPFLPGMVERGSGRILFVSSIVGKRGTPYYSAYSASKFALDGMADALRAELVGSGVSLGVIYPSSTTTEFDERRLSEGPSQNKVRPRRHPPESVAREIVAMAGNRRRGKILGAEARLMWFVDLFAPGLIDRILARILRG